MAGYTTPAWTNGAAPAISAANLQTMGQGIELAQHPYGVCSTAAATAAKSVTIDFSGTLALFVGLTVRIKFSNSNTAPNPTLNVNGTGAKPIMAYGTTNAGTWMAGQTLSFTYDGTNWLYNGVEAFTKAQTLSAATAAVFNANAGSTPATPDAALNLLATALSGSAYIATGTYIGTGTWGQDNPTTLSFPFTPMLVAVFEQYTNQATLGIAPANNYYSWYDGFLWSYSATRVGSYLIMDGAQGQGIYNASNNFTLNGNTLSWWANLPYQVYDPRGQFNGANTVYRYIAIGSKSV